MSCTRPLRGYMGVRKTKKGENARKFIMSLDDPKLEVTCGWCMGCRMDKAQAWKLRLLHEASCWDANTVVTLTYSDDLLTKFRQGRRVELVYRDFQLFMYRLRVLANRKPALFRGRLPSPDGDFPVRFFVAGEYGGKNGRPHFHAILFNVWFSDSVQYYNGTFRSETLRKLWRYDQDPVLDTMSPESAAYVVGYTLKKRGKLNRHFQVDPVTAEVKELQREFHQMSRDPGIGAYFQDKNGADMLPQDRCVSDGKEWKVPRYYTERWKKTATEEEIKRLLTKREDRAMEQYQESSGARRAVREEWYNLVQENFDNRNL